MKHTGSNFHSFTFGMVSNRNGTPSLSGTPPDLDSQPIPSTLSDNRLQLAEKGSPYLTMALEWFVWTGQASSDSRKNGLLFQSNRKVKIYKICSRDPISVPDTIAVLCKISIYNSSVADSRAKFISHPRGSSQKPGTGSFKVNWSHAVLRTISEK